jgi:hypothetical protein
MNNAIALAQFWGWLALVVSGIFFARPDVLREVKILMIENRPFSLSYGLLSLILGLASVTLYNDWTPSWQVVVSLFGWLALLKGILVLAGPKLRKAVARDEIALDAHRARRDQLACDLHDRRQLAVDLVFEAAPRRRAQIELQVHVTDGARVRPLPMRRDPGPHWPVPARCDDQESAT